MAVCGPFRRYGSIWRRVGRSVTVFARSECRKAALFARAILTLSTAIHVKFERWSSVALTTYSEVIFTIWSVNEIKPREKTGFSIFLAQFVIRRHALIEVTVINGGRQKSGLIEMAISGLDSHLGRLKP